MTVIINSSDISDLTLDISEREIYNDIRSECDVTEILSVRPDSTPDLFKTFRATAHLVLSAHSTTTIYAEADKDHSEIVWLDIVDYSFSGVTIPELTEAECLALDPDAMWWIARVVYGHFPCCVISQGFLKSDIEWEITSRGTTTCSIEVTNNSNFDIRGSWDVGYMALTPETRYLKLRSTDGTSIKKYGRRVMDLRWYVGQTPNQMQSIIDGYRDKYSEPVPITKITLLGKTDSAVSTILSLKTDVKVALRFSELNIHDYFMLNVDKLDEDYLAPDDLSFNGEFWVNNVSISHDVNGVLEGIFDLENVRPCETYLYFELDVGKLDESYIAP